MDDLTRALAEALGCEKNPHGGRHLCEDYCKRHMMHWYVCERRAEHVAAALAPLIEARVREARATELEDVADAFASSANRVAKAKGETERTRYAHEVVEVLRNRADEVRRRNA